MQTNNSSNQVNPDEFRVGDTVWCVLYGEGKVTYISEDCIYPIEVVFPDGDVRGYTSNGQYTEEANRTLFFSEPKIEASVTRPFVPTLVGKRVVVKEYSCYPQLLYVEWEDEGRFGDKDHTCLKLNCEVYEVGSENLLK